MTKNSTSNGLSPAHFTQPPTREINFKARPNKMASHRTHYVLDWDRRDLIAEVSDAGLLVFEYYLSLVRKQPAQEITDETTAAYFGWDLSKAKRIRLKLTRAGWFRERKFSYGKGHPGGTTYYIGKDEVQESHNGNTAPFKSP